MWPNRREKNMSFSTGGFGDALSALRCVYDVYGFGLDNLNIDV